MKKPLPNTATGIAHQMGISDQHGLVLSRAERRRRGYRQPLPKGIRGGTVIPGSPLDQRINELKELDHDNS